jgi:hypothetical protein
MRQAKRMITWKGRAILMTIGTGFALAARCGVAQPLPDDPPTAPATLHFGGANANANPNAYTTTNTNTDINAGTHTDPDTHANTAGSGNRAAPVLTSISTLSFVPLVLPPKGGAASNAPVRASVTVAEGGPASAPQPSMARPDLPPSGGTVAELEGLIRASALSELRTTYNGSFGASLLLNVSRMEYYVALFEGKHFLRVLKYTGKTQAESTYAAFADQSGQLAEADIHRVVLTGENDALRKRLAAVEDQERQLAADLRTTRAGEQAIAAHQAAVGEQASTLAKQTDGARAELNASLKRVRELERLNNDVWGSAGTLAH